MKQYLVPAGTALVAAFALSLTAAPAFSQTPAPGPPVQVVVTAEPHKGATLPAITKNDVTVMSGKESLEVLDWIPAQGPKSALQLYVVLDDSSGSSLGTQLSDIKQFIESLPSNVSVAVGYMDNGTVRDVQNMTNDHAAAAAKVRLPIGVAGANGSPYFSLVDLVKRWPETEGRREILMVSDGVDRYYGAGPDDPYVAEAIRAAQRGGIVVSSIYWRGTGHFGHSFFLNNWGQNYLGQLADETGGEFYWQGLQDPVSFAPYLQEFSDRLNHQYFLVFRAKPERKGGVDRIRVRTEVPHVDLVAPSGVWVPGAK